MLLRALRRNHHKQQACLCSMKQLVTRHDPAVGGAHAPPLPPLPMRPAKPTLVVAAAAVAAAVAAAAAAVAAAPLAVVAAVLAQDLARNRGVARLILLILRVHLEDVEGGLWARQRGAWAADETLWHGDAQFSKACSAWKLSPSQRRGRFAARCAKALAARPANRHPPPAASPSARPTLPSPAGPACRPGRSRV